MAIKWVRGTASSFIDSPNRSVDRIETGFDMVSLVEDAAGMMKDLIASRGTNRTWGGTWYGRSGSGPGRIDTGNMYDAVTYQVSRAGGSIRGEFGWVSEQDPYFMYQEEGFQHFITGEHVPAMLALQDAGIAAREEFVRRLTLAVKNG